MFAPTRLFLSLRPQAPAGLIFSAIVVAALFAATPFLLPAAKHYIPDYKEGIDFPRYVGLWTKVDIAQASGNWPQIS